jgi:catechol 2,3-dioxygenase-like lactoylglutathione lyase family enzyme
VAIAVCNGFSCGDLAKAKSSYVDTLGFEVTDETMGLGLKQPGGGCGAGYRLVQRFGRQYIVRPPGHKSLKHYCSAESA